jgi:hypothetical protein
MLSFRKSREFREARDAREKDVQFVAQEIPLFERSLPKKEGWEAHGFRGDR